MRHVRMLGLCLVAALAVCAYAVSSASALPEWGQCNAKEGGKYENSNCTTKAKGKTGVHAYEWTKGTNLENVPFWGHNVGSGGVLSTKLEFCEAPNFEEPRYQEIDSKRISKKECLERGGSLRNEFSVLKVECEQEYNSGEAYGKNKLKNLDVKFYGCAVFGSLPCSNTTYEGEITVNPLNGEIGYINKSEHKVGVRLTPAKKKGEFARFVCGGFLATAVGAGNSKEGAWYEPESKGGNDAIISPITPVNTATSTYEQQFTVNEATQENIPSKFENKPISLLEDFEYNAEEPERSSTWSAAGEEITNKNNACEHQYWVGGPEECEAHPFVTEIKA